MNDGRHKGNERNKNSYREVQVDILRGNRKIAAVDKGANGENECGINHIICRKLR